MKIYDLRTEYRENPAGLAAAAPRFSWKMKTDEKNTMQDLYRIEVVSEEETVWDTGIRKSSESVLVPYEGKLKLERFSMDSTLAEIVAESLAVQMFNKFAPGMLDGPMVQMAMQMSLAEMLGMAPDARPMFEAVVNALNAQEE